MIKVSFHARPKDIQRVQRQLYGHFNYGDAELTVILNRGFVLIPEDHHSPYWTIESLVADLKPLCFYVGVESPQDDLRWGGTD